MARIKVNPKPLQEAAARATPGLQWAFNWKRRLGCHVVTALHAHYQRLRSSENEQ